MRIVAADTRKISYESKVNAIYDMIIETAEMGENSFCVEIIDEDIIKQLKEDGYEVIDLNHSDRYRIKW